MAGRIGILQFPGTNCEVETMRAVKYVGLEGDIIRWNESERVIRTYDGYIIPGGFAHQDRVRAGVIAAKESVMGILMEEAEKGKPIIGICNGCQILIETGLIPGLEVGRVEMAMAKNRMEGRWGFYHRFIYIKRMSSSPDCVVNININDDEVIIMPVAHAEGRFTTTDKDVIKAIEARELAGFVYTDIKGNDLVDFPDNPNGAMFNLAGISNIEGNVFGLMPHPERSIFEFNIFSIDKNKRKITLGYKIFISLKIYLEVNK
ncbi:MAG: phosphoribosylformylglycinamidine synthase I [bacterium]